MASVADQPKLLCSESTNVQNNDRTTNSILSDRLYGEHYPDSFLDVSKPLRTANHGGMDNNDRYVHQEHKQPYKPNVSSSAVNHQPNCDCTNNIFATDYTTTNHPTVCASNGDSSRGTQTRDIEYELTTNKPSDKQLNDFNESANFDSIPKAKVKHRWLEPCVIVGAS
jgi:hypothetical protein